MPNVAGDAADSVGGLLTRRWQVIDPLLPAPQALQPGCGAGLLVVGTADQPSAIGSCEHWQGLPGSLALTWGAACRVRLTAQIAGPDVAPALDQLLSQWRDHLADVPCADGEDTAAVVTWPSRDVDGVNTLLRHGLAPLAVIAARSAGRHSTGHADAATEQLHGAAGQADSQDPDQGWAAEPVGAGLRIRRAGPADLDTVVRLGMEVVRFDARFGAVIERAETKSALRRDVARSLAGPDAWTWLAERDYTAIGMLYAERPESTGWIAPMARPQPVAYLELMYVMPGERGRGVSAALVARLHRAADTAGVAVTLLHYAQVNPLSAPFWSQQGYRPLWTSWEARPARAIR
jgi:GNAT superfamily N-acetyltransferase